MDEPTERSLGLAVGTLRKPRGEAAARSGERRGSSSSFTASSFATDTRLRHRALAATWRPVGAGALRAALGAGCGGPRTSRRTSRRLSRRGLTCRHVDGMPRAMGTWANRSTVSDAAEQPETGVSGHLIVDVHTHFLPLEVVDFFASADAPDAVRVEDREGRDALLVHKNGLAYPVFSVFHEPAAKLAEMDRLGIDFALVSIVPTLFLYELEPAETARTHRAINDAAANYTARGGGRLGAMGTVPLNNPDAAVRELHRCADLGLKGVEIGTSAGSLALDAPDLDPFFAAAAELGMPVMLHPYEMMLQEPPPGLQGFHLANVIGNPQETFIAASRLMVAGVLDKHSGLKILLVHGGGSLPYQFGRLQHAYHGRSETRSVAHRAPSEYLNSFLFDTVVFDDRALAFLLTMVGEDRVLFGTDLPFDMADLSAIESVAKLTGCNREAILGANALRCFDLDVPPRAAAPSTVGR